MYTKTLSQLWYTLKEPYSEVVSRRVKMGTVMNDIPRRMNPLRVIHSVARFTSESDL